MRSRTSGILLHLTSLPSRFGIGDLGPEAYRWVDFLEQSCQRFWQVLPVNPTTHEGRNSPYRSSSAFAGNPLLISPELLRDDGLLTDQDLEAYPGLPTDRVDYDQVIPHKRRLLERAHEVLRSRGPNHNRDWLDDFTLFVALRERHAGRPPVEWAPPLRDRDPEALETALRDEAEVVERERFLQYVFHNQWLTLKRYAAARGVHIAGDLPFYVGYESADVWSHPGLFKLDESKKRTVVAGVPPDSFSADGQLWGNPIFDWETHKSDGYAWWVSRLRRNLDMFDLVRLDHFRGFAAHWEVDLGLIPPDVRELLRDAGLPGMKVLLFAFGGETGMNPYTIHNHDPGAVVYTGTHDNNTVRGWFETEASPEETQAVAEYLGTLPSHNTIHDDFIRMAMMSVGQLTVIPMQDWLGLGAEARMNRPAVEDGNWEWRMGGDAATADLANRITRITKIYGRV